MQKLIVGIIASILLVVPFSNSSADCGLCGDLNGDGKINIVDLVAFINGNVDCPSAADMNCDGAVIVGSHPQSDLQILINYMFYGGPAPCDPVAFPDCR